MGEKADENLRVTDKEIFYSAMMLNFDRLVGVEYIFPADEEKLAKELNEAKRSLHRKKLLKESSKGEISLDFALSALVTFCAAPDKCVVVDEPGYYAVAYGAADSFMLLERGEEDNAARWFGNQESMDEYIKGKLAGMKAGKAGKAGKADKEEAKADGGA